MPFAPLRVAAALWLAAALTPLTLASEATLKTFDVCVRTLRNAPYLRARDDIDWEELKSEWRPRADASAPGEELRLLLNEMLTELDASHTAVLRKEVYQSMVHELAGKPSPTFGVLLEEMVPDRLFVRAMYEKGPAERAGLLLGDELIAVDGEPWQGSEEVIDAGYDPGAEKSRLFTLRPASVGAELELQIRSRGDVAVRQAQVACEATSGLEAGRRSLRVVRQDGRRIGVIHLWMVARGSAALMAEALRGPFASCDAVVVDLRGRGGYADEIDGILAPFRAAHGGRQAARGVVPWRKPVAFLIDDRTRSAKEILSWYVRHEHLGPLVGEATEGAVLGAGFFPLPGGSYLEVGMMEVPVGDGSSLEGVGVNPTVPVQRAGAFAAGGDPILRRGVALMAAAAAAQVSRRGPF